MRSIGNFLVLFSVFGVIMTFGPTLYYELQFRIVQARGIEYKVVDNTNKETPLGKVLAQAKGNPGGLNASAGSLAQVVAGPTEQILYPIDTQFGIVIPRIGANAKVIPNVDPIDENEFLQDLSLGVAHAKGTVFPGMQGNVYLFAHSTDNWWNVGRYNALFYLLKELEQGDDVIVYFEDIRHNYTVYDSVIVDPSEVSFVTQAQHGGEETLILQTCWPPGTTWNRLLVFARPK